MQIEPQLRAYRADPTDHRFTRVYRAATPWLKATGISTLRTYPCLSASGALDDLTLEGALSLSRAARRFVYLCDVCGEASVHVSDLSAHYRVVHRKRGVALVSLSTFAKTSARLAIKRTARRLVRAEILEPEIDLGVDDGAEDAILFAALVSQMGDHLWARARESLRAILFDAWTPADVERVRDAVTAHIG